MFNFCTTFLIDKVFIIKEISNYTMENVKENASEKNIVKDTKEKIVVANDGLNFFERFPHIT